MKQKVNFELDLTIDELCNFFGMVYGLSFVSTGSQNSKDVSEIMTELTAQTENIILKTDPEKIHLLNKVKYIFKQELMSRKNNN